MIRTVIIDDESTAREAITHMIGLYGDNNIEIVGYGDTVRSGIDSINKNNPDLVLLDIKMPDGNGFEVLKAFGDINFDIIFITAYEQYAIKAFKFAALDYLLKPIDPDEFRKAIGRTGKNKENKSYNMQVKMMMEHLKRPTIQRDDKKIVLRCSDTIHLVYVNDIMRVESDRNYSTFYIVNEEHPITVTKAMRNFVDVLEDYGFVRVHQSHIINTDHIIKYQKNDCVLVMRDDSQVPVSIRKRDFLLKRFEEL